MKTIVCPTSYGPDDYKRDLEQLNKVKQEWASSKMPRRLSPLEDAKEAQLVARVHGFGPRLEIAHSRILDLDEQELMSGLTLEEERERMQLEKQYPFDRGGNIMRQHFKRMRKAYGG